MWRQNEKSAPILGELPEGAQLYQRTKPGGYEEVLVQKEWMNLRRSLWKCEEGKKQKTKENEHPEEQQ